MICKYPSSYFRDIDIHVVHEREYKKKIHKSLSRQQFRMQKEKKKALKSLSWQRFVKNNILKNDFLKKKPLPRQRFPIIF